MRILIAMFLLVSTQLTAQNTIAKFKYEDAEKFFYDKKYQECIENLNEVESMLGQTAPNILHLKIMAQHELFKTNPRDFELLSQLRINCNEYLSNYDIQGLEEKYRDVYGISQKLNKTANSEEEYHLEIDKNVRDTFKKNIMAVGGFKAIENVKVIVYKGVVKTDNIQSKYEEKISSVDKIPEITLGNKDLKSVLEEQNSRLAAMEAKASDEGAVQTLSCIECFNSIFSESYFLSKMDDPQYEFSFEVVKDKKFVTIIFKDTYRELFIRQMRMYDSKTSLLNSVSISFSPIDPENSSSKYEGYLFNSYRDYRLVNGLMLAHDRTVTVKTESISTSYIRISEIRIN